MNTYLSMLRGINVGAQKKVLMADLKIAYEELKFKAVTTYIQSGNVVFQTKENVNTLPSKIEKKILEKFGFEVPIILKTEEDLIRTLHENPFLKEKELQLDKLYVTFLYDAPKPELMEKLQAFQTLADRFAIVGETVYLYCPNGYGTSKLNNNFFESKLNVKATTRNWRSVNELLKLMQAT